MMLPTGGCQKSWHSHMTAHIHHLGDYCFGTQVEIILGLLTTEDTKAYLTSIAGHVTFPYEIDYAMQALSFYVPRYWQAMVEATVHAAFDPDGTGQKSLSYNDLHCESCGRYVSQVLESDHWDLICGSCYSHKNECTCCGECGYVQEDCQCCQTCGSSSGWCDCCSYCGCETCECRTCEDCGYAVHYCHCSSSGGYGHTKKAPWNERDAEPIGFTLPLITDCRSHEIDPLSAVADFYLLDAIKGMVRLSNAEPFVNGPDRRDVLNVRAKDAIASDTMLSAIRLAATRDHARLVETLTHSFLAYSVAAVGGELRYHKACGKGMLTNDRNKAWERFTGLVQERGASLLFDAEKLFKEFGGGAYGGEKWGNVAKVVGNYLNGTIPAWLFVDRIFNAVHNGGPFINKVSWKRSNVYNWGLDKIVYVLNAHAGKDEYHEDVPTDWDLLVKMASPEVRDMWFASEKHLNRLSRRFGAFIPAYAPTKRKKSSYSY